MGDLHDVLRYLLARVPAHTQDEHDQVAALIDEDEAGESPGQHSKKETSS